MNYSRLFALTAVIFTIAVGLVALFSARWDSDVADYEVEAAVFTLPPVTSSTSSTISDGVLSYALALSTVEEELEQMARTSASSSTTSSTTTTAPVVTRSTTAATPQPKPTTTTTQPKSTPTTVTAEYRPGAESEFLGSINSLRGSLGLPSLSRNGSLDARARDWAKAMADSGKLKHSNISSLVPPWSAAAENVGKGGSVSGIFNLLVGSGGHYKNMAGDYTAVGIGVWRDHNGTLWTVHVFTR